MSKPKDEKKAEEKKPTTEEVVKKLEAELSETKVAIKTMAEAIVKLNEKIEGKAGGSSGGTGSGTDFVSLLARLAEGKKEVPLEELAKTVEGLTRTVEAFDRFRNPPRLGIGEAYLMRLGIRAAYPRYMTKAELTRAERLLGITESLGEEGSETEHVE